MKLDINKSVLFCFFKLQIYLELDQKKYLGKYIFP